MADIDDALASVLAGCVPGFERLVSANRLSGGASQETYRINLEAGGAPLTLAMRRAAGGVSEPEPGRPGLEVEARLFRVARDAGVPEPRILHVLGPDDGLGAGFVMEWLEGETLGARVLRAPELDGIRPRLAYEAGRVLARIHGIDTAATGLDQVLHAVPTEDFIEQIWERYRLFETPQPMIDYTARWLLDHVPDHCRTTLVHNDFRNGNLMIAPDGIAAVLDWELAHLGDPLRDLGWICTNSWRFGRTEHRVGGFGELDDLLRGYQDESGIAVDPAHVHFWEVFGSYWWAVGCLGMADSWRNGPDPTVERPGIARRSSECQVDCANLIIPGPVALVEADDAISSIDTPTTEELLASVRDFLREDVRSATEGRNNFLALVAANSIDIVRRELTLAPAHRAAEVERLRSMFTAPAGALTELRWALTTGLRDGSIDLDHDGLADHLRATVVNQLAIDQPRYSGLANALGEPGA
ncbi:MAG: phosphotransferase family protein [Actinomycetota bacterium]